MSFIQQKQTKNDNDPFGVFQKFYLQVIKISL